VYVLEDEPNPNVLADGASEIAVEKLSQVFGSMGAREDR